MNSLASCILCTSSFLLLMLLLSSHPPQRHPFFSPRGLLFEAKTRIGSTPPSCHNKCNGCHPCLAIEVPSMTSHDAQPRSVTVNAVVTGFSDHHPSPQDNANRYSNYKPLGWKCRCGNHFYNP